MLLPKPSQELDLMYLTRWGIISPTSVYSYQRTVGGHSLPPIPRPKVGFGRTNHTNAHAHELLILAACKAVSFK